MSPTADKPIDDSEQAGQWSITTSSEVSNATRPSPVSCLPIDILLEIFLIYVQWSHYDSDWSWGIAQTPQWLHVTHVCRHWREAALNFKTLWSYMFVVSRNWTNTLLARSGDVPLRVLVYFSGKNEEQATDFMQQVIPHAGRFQECFLTLYSLHVGRFFPAMSLQSATILRRLKIQLLPVFYTPLNIEEELAEDAAEDTPDVTKYTLFNGDLPALCELNLENYPLSWSPHTLGTIKVLRLHDIRYAHRPTIMQLKSILSGMPNLERLQVAVRGGRSDPSLLDAERVNLPRLTFLMVTGHLSTVACFLSWLEIPLTARLRLGCRLRPVPDEDDYGPFFAFLSRIFGRCPAGTSYVPRVWDTLIVRQTDLVTVRHYMHIALRNTQQGCGQPECCYSLMGECGCDMPLKLEIGWPSGLERCHNLVFGICRSISLAPMQKLVVANCVLPQQFWFDIIWHLRNLRAIKFVQINFKDILDLFAHPARLPPDHVDTPPSQRGPQVFVQSLEELSLCSIPPIDRKVRCGGDEIRHGGKQVERFCNILSQRSMAAGVSLSRLVISGRTPFIAREEARRLEEVVGQVVVPGGAQLLPERVDVHCDDCKWPVTDP